MILVTTGTTMPFPQLLAEVDRLAGEGLFDEPVICQTGQSGYRPQYCEGFAFRGTLDDLYAEASLVITHGGSTVFTLLGMGRPFIAFPNPMSADAHQLHVLARLAEQSRILWSAEVADLARLYRRWQWRGEPAHFDTPRLGDGLRDYIQTPR